MPLRLRYFALPNSGHKVIMNNDIIRPPACFLDLIVHDENNESHCCGLKYLNPLS